MKATRNTVTPTPQPQIMPKAVQNIINISKVDTIHPSNMYA